jgi:hypothetical protein
MIASAEGGETKKRDPKIRFRTPKQIVNYEPPENELLIGDSHIVKGRVFVIGGPPGIGKSRSATELAMCGVTGNPWFGLPVHTPFKTMIIQNENGPRRLMHEYRERANIEQANDSIWVSEPPPFGLSFGDNAFVEDLQESIDIFKPDLVIIDPWNAVASGDAQRDYAEAFNRILSVLPKGNDKPALGIVAHTRKPKSEELRTGGSALMHLLSGSHMLASVPRSVFIMLSANELDETDRHRVWFNPKNNDGLEVARTVWRLSETGFSQAKGFDWDQFDEGPKRRLTMTEEMIRKALSEAVDRKGAINRLMDASGLGQRACEIALEEEGKFSHLFEITDDGYYQLK